MSKGAVKSWVHANIWQRLPQGMRRAALFQATALAAPRPTANAKPALPIIVAGALTTATGLGESARLCHDALKAAGLPVYGIDLSAVFMQPQDFPGFAFDDGRQIEGAGTLLLFVNAPTVPLAMLRLGGRFIRAKHIVGYWAWELPEVPADWRHGVPFVHQVWAPTVFAGDAFRPVAGRRPVLVLPYPVAMRAPIPATRPRAADHPFTVLAVFNTASSFTRKNPVAAIHAFRRAFADDTTTRLVVKVSNLDVFPDGRRLLDEARGGAANIDILDQTMSHAGLDALYAAADCVISLHRSEGFGLIIAEAMLRGIPAVATDWSGSVDFLDAGVGMPVRQTLVPAIDSQGVYNHPAMRWADADVADAADALRRLRANPDLRARLGAAARQRAQRIWSAESYVASVKRHLGL